MLRTAAEGLIARLRAWNLQANWDYNTLIFYIGLTAYTACACI